MRVACGFVIALWLILPVPGMALQEPDRSPDATRQPPLPAAPLGNAPPSSANPHTSADQKASENGAEKKTAGSATASAGKRRKRPAPSAAEPKPGDPPRKIVVREGGAKEPAAQIEPDITPAEAQRERLKAEQLLDSSDGQLQQLAARTLNAQQQETVEQIRNYMAGARSALKEGDVRRAGTLAEKAHLLADDLVKH
jgi:hypothetical protein